MKTKAVLFARVSTREQAEEGYSLLAQEKLISEYANKKDLQIVKSFSVPESARGKQERKLFNSLLDYTFKNPQIKIVLCEKVDRITRNFKDAVKLDDWLKEDEERQIHFVKQNLIIHKNSRSHEVLQWDIYLALARQYSNNLSEETKKGLNEKAEQGWYPGNHKRGYLCLGDIGHKTWVIDGKKPDAKFIEMAFVLYNSGNYTLRTLSKELYQQGWFINGKQVSISELHKLLSDPFYCGQFIFRNKLYENAKHPPLITKELFYSVQDQLQRKTKSGKYRKHVFLFGGSLLNCGECGRSITAEVQKGHPYYHCTKYTSSCTQRKYVREEKIEKQTLEILDSIKIQNPKLLEWVRGALKEAHQAGSKYHEETIEELDREYLKAKRRLDTLYDDKVDGKISKDFYERRQVEYEEQLNHIVEAKQQHCKANIDYLKLGINIFELAQKGRQIYENMLSLNEKRELLSFVFSNLKLKDEILTPSFTNGFQVVAERVKSGDLLRDLDSNQDKRIQSPLSYH